MILLKIICRTTKFVAIFAAMIKTNTYMMMAMMMCGEIRCRAIVM